MSDDIRIEKIPARSRDEVGARLEVNGITVELTINQIVRLHRMLEESYPMICGV